MTRRLFVRIYVALVAVIVVGVIAVAAWELARRQPGDEGWVEASASAPAVVRAAFAAGGDAEALRKISHELVVDARLFAIADAPRGLQPRLAAGHPAVPHRGDGPELWVPVDDQRVVRLRPDEGRPVPVPILAGVLFLGTGLAVAWQLRPLDRDLSRLAGAAERFGRGELTARAGLAPNSAVADLGERFDGMAARIGGLVQARQDLLLAVSHELRTPLHRLRFAIEVLDDGSKTTEIENIHRDIDALDALVGELLAWGRVDAQAIRREVTDLRALTEPLALDARRLRPDARVDVTGEGRASVDPDLVRRSLSCVLTNAVRYGNGAVRVTIADGRVQVDDDGPGIPANQRERVREPFARLDAARNRDAGGSGLGLALADRVCRAHGGALTFGDSDLGGLSAQLTFPDAA